MTRGRRLNRLSLVFVIALAPVVAGCTSACQSGLADGVLVQNVGELDLMAPDGTTSPVAWPSGYTIRDVAGRKTLFDSTGTAKAREGDHIQVAGGLGTDDRWHACGDITVLAPPS